MFARALYSYTARNEKELSFKKGDVLAVVEKSSDGNWWDGVFEDKRGYIPVSYVEIAPIPPQRKSSMRSMEEEGKAEKAEKIAPTNVQILENVPEEDEAKSTKSDNSVSGTEGIRPSSSVPNTSVSSEAIKPEPEKQVRKKVNVPVTSGAVSKLTQQFQSTTEKPPATPPAQQPPPPRVLVPAHKRNQSADMSGRPEAPNLHVRTGSTGRDSEHLGFRAKEAEHFVPRSSSDGSRATKPVVAMPPPVKPKPAAGMDSAPTPAVTPFQIMPHDSGATASPLQKAALQHQVHLPHPSGKKGSGGKIKQGSIKLSGKAKPPIPSKPAAPPKPASATQLQAEIQAAADLRRKRYDGDSSQ